MSKHCVVYITVSKRDEATRIIDALLDQRLIACANIMSGVESRYWWQGKKEASQEVFVIVKTRTDLFEKLQACVVKEHSYEVPEIIALPIITGATAYLDWIDAEVASVRS